MNIEPTPVRYPIDIRCPIGGGVFAKGKAGKFAVTGTPAKEQEAAAHSYKGVFEKGEAGKFAVTGTPAKEQEDAAGDYKKSTYREINQMLRGELTNKKYEKEYKEYASKLGSLIEHHGVTEGAGVVYRSVDTDHINVSHYESKVGQKITLPGFLSTSKSQEYAKSFTEDGVSLRIYVPKGAKALDYEAMKNKSSTGFKDKEHEVILPHNSQFTVHAVGKDKSGKPIIDLIMHR